MQRCSMAKEIGIILTAVSDNAVPNTAPMVSQRPVRVAH